MTMYVKKKKKSPKGTNQGLKVNTAPAGKMETLQAIS